ncbi:MAG: mechanosensitive ion channel family protein [Armatimonadota bacterium]|nr:mechanosensitive ion channel family protein [Armatimonadota bacterium]
MLKTAFSGKFWSGILEKAGAGVLDSAGDLIKIVLLYLIARALIFKLIDKVVAPAIAREPAGPQSARVKTLHGLMRSVAGYLLFFIAAIMALRALRVDPVPALTTAGVAGLAIGFGAQRLVRDVISGFFILLENQYSVGEYVTMAGVTGIVEEMGMRITRIRDDAGKLNIIANGDITTVCNHSRGAVSVSVDISVPADSDLEKVIGILNQAEEELATERGMSSPLKYEGVTAMDAAKLTLRFSGSCDAVALEDVQMAARQQFRDALRHAGISLV